MIRKSILAALAPLALAGCAGGGGYAGPDSADIASARVATVNAQQLATLVEAGEVVLIDVRTPYEFADSRIAGALNAPLTHFDPATIPVDTTREVILYCGSSRRSGIAAERLAEYRGTVVRHLEGGIRAWTDAGYPTVSNDPSDDPRR
ncbi:rhodanese-like domain-containing protein [Qipengyuania aquimaris]|uniref:Rhodanese-like domain-containing protein n=1 Tax=Qipengyuania xiapuensis TaxID=2867236 RepID=A0ABX8ZS68_9SPHN|nr:MULTISPECIES: rhodanese-like domain-containing protein [Qipengyuania]MBY6129733.1 rhodanese-like domain-containing protein [Qipengyuania aquimaris]QZD91868.1 rhodanese-like domain-containing protein [Qipengyuania xiapuensis]